jgi:hypothetical protein
VAAIGHTEATTAQIAAAVSAGATLSTHLGNGAHAVLRRHPNYIWDQLAEDRLMADFIADGIHLDASFLKVALRAKGVERSVLVTDAAPPAGAAPGRYRLGEQEVYLTGDGRVVLAGPAGTPTDRLAGSALRMDRGIANLIRLAGLSLADAVRMATVNAARAGGFPGAAASREGGSPADPPPGAAAGLGSGALAEVAPGARADLKSGPPADLAPGAAAGLGSGALSGVAPGARADLKPGPPASLEPGGSAGLKPGPLADLTPGTRADLESGAPAGLPPDPSARPGTGAPTALEPGVPTVLERSAAAGLAPGAPADLVQFRFDPAEARLEIISTWLAGRQVFP